MEKKKLTIIKLKDRIIFPKAPILLTNAQFNCSFQNNNFIILKPFFAKAKKIIKPIVFLPEIVITKNFKFEELENCYRFSFDDSELYYPKIYEKVILPDGPIETNIVNINFFPYLPCPNCGINLYPDKFIFYAKKIVYYDIYLNLENPEESNKYITDETDTEVDTFYCNNCEEVFEIDNYLYGNYFFTIFIEAKEIHEIIKKEGRWI